MASMSLSPVRILTARATGYQNTFPSPGSTVRAAFTIRKAQR